MQKPGLGNPLINNRSSNFEELRQRFNGGAQPQPTGPQPKSTVSTSSPKPSVHSHQVALPTVESSSRQLQSSTDTRPVQDLSSGGTKLESSPLFLRHAPKSKTGSTTPRKLPPPPKSKTVSTTPRKLPTVPSFKPVLDPQPSTSKSVSNAPVTVEPLITAPVDVAPQGPVVKFSEGDFLYGPDTGIQKPRTLLRKFIQTKSEAAGQRVWSRQIDDTLKIDSLTAGMGPKPPAPTRHQLGGRSLGDAPSGTPNTQGALPSGWKLNTTVPSRYIERESDKAEFVEWIANHPRFNPDLSPEHTDWNARFKRTSKAGLQFALKEKGYNVHFVLPKGTNFDQIVQEASSHPRHAAAKYEAFYQDGKGGETGPIEEKRITHAELRWLFRHKDDPSVKNNVQFWEYDPKQGTDGFAPVAPPWERDSRPWDEYAEARVRKPQRVGDTYSIQPQAPVTPAPSTGFVVDGTTFTRKED